MNKNHIPLKMTRLGEPVDVRLDDDSAGQYTVREGIVDGRCCEKNRFWPQLVFLVIEPAIASDLKPWSTPSSWAHG